MIAITTALLLAQSAALSPAPHSANAPVNQRVIEPFERDEVLKDWGMRFYDRDKDARLSLQEAWLAARAFKDIADKDRDGRITTSEYNHGRDYLILVY